MQTRTLEATLALLPEGWATTPGGRRAACHDDPVLFAWVYFNRHLRSPETGDQVTLSPVHYGWAERAKTWMTPATEPASDRTLYAGPRAMGKSTWWTLILPCWAAAYGHVKFIATFADSGPQAEQRLSSLKRELETNALLRTDFADLCTPARRPRGSTVADNRMLVQAQSGFVMIARGIEAGALGMNIEGVRPDLIILDDVEPGAANYSAHQARKRLDTIQNVILPLNVFARVVWVGTVTMDGSLVHQAVKPCYSSEDKPAWAAEDGWLTSYWPPILAAEDGTESSIWPEKWSMEYLASIRHTRSFALNYSNRPMPLDSSFWSEADFTYGEAEAYPRTLISIDPAVTTKKTSDYTGIAVLSLVGTKVYVRNCWQVRLSPKELCARVAQIIGVYPEATALLVETNQGGDTWASIFAGLPLRYTEVKQSVRKETRATWLLNGMQRGDVLFERRLPDLEAQMMTYPNVLHDDMIDAVGSGFVRLRPEYGKHREVTTLRTRVA